MKIWLKTGLIGAIISIIFTIIIVIIMAATGAEINFRGVIFGGVATTFYEGPTSFITISIIYLIIILLEFSIPGFVIGIIFGLIYEKLFLKYFSYTKPVLKSNKSSLIISNKKPVIKKEQPWKKIK